MKEIRKPNSRKVFLQVICLAGAISIPLIAGYLLIVGNPVLLASNGWVSCYESRGVMAHISANRWYICNRQKYYTSAGAAPNYMLETPDRAVTIFCTDTSAFFYRNGSELTPVEISLPGNNHLTETIGATNSAFKSEVLEWDGIKLSIRVTLATGSLYKIHQAYLFELVGGSLSFKDESFEVEGPSDYIPSNYK
jgi:hypothetical protein